MLLINYPIGITTMPSLSEVVVDNADLDLMQSKWSVYKHRSTWYVGNNRDYLHRKIYARIIGRALTSSELVDHIDGNGLNNSRTNLRIATTAENCRNAKTPKSNTSGYKGVSLHKGKWLAQIMFNRKSYFLGLYDTALSAAIAYNHAAIEYFGAFARVNDIADWQSIKVQRIEANVRPRKNTSSQYLGVSCQGNRWIARATINGKRVCIGTFPSAEAAHEARLKALMDNQ